jgi:hypothetical protein
MSLVDDDRTRDIAEAAGRSAAREMALLIGIDVSTPAGVQRAQRNWAFLDDLRSGTSMVKRKIVLTVIGSIITAIVGYLVLFFRSH